MEERDIVKRDAGQVTEGVLSRGEIDAFNNLLSVCDKSPVLKDPKDPMANQDFALFNGNIEISRNFAIKTARMFTLNRKTVGHQFIETKDDLHVAVDVMVWDDRGEVTASGGCSMSEIEKKAGAGRSATRPFHDALAIAETRALKRAIEEKVGLPFINEIIRQVFGGYEIRAKNLREVRQETKKEAPKDESVRSMMLKAHDAIAKAKKDGLFGKMDCDQWWNRVLSCDAVDKVSAVYEAMMETIRSREGKRGTTES